MRVFVQDAIPYLRRCYTSGSSAEKLIIKKLTKFFLAEHHAGKTCIPAKRVYRRVGLVGSSSAVKIIRAIWRLFTSFSPPGWADTLEFRHFKRIAKKSQKKPKTASSAIPSPGYFKSCIARLFKKNKAVLALGLLVMLISGKRKKDVSRIKSQDVHQIDGATFAISLDYDKTHAFSQFFTLDFSLSPEAWACAPPEALGQAFSVACSCSSTPFSALDSSNLVRMVGFRPHSLRSLASIFRTWLGWSDAAITEDIGWASKVSLARYRCLSAAMIRRASSVEEAVSWLAES